MNRIFKAFLLLTLLVSTHAFADSLVSATCQNEDGKEHVQFDQSKFVYITGLFNKKSAPMLAMTDQAAVTRGLLAKLGSGYRVYAQLDDQDNRYDTYVQVDVSHGEFKAGDHFTFYYESCRGADGSSQDDCTVDKVEPNKTLN